MKLLSNKDLLDCIDRNGLEWAIMSQIDASEIEDEETEVLWIDAEEALVKLMNHLDSSAEIDYLE